MKEVKSKISFWYSSLPKWMFTLQILIGIILSFWVIFNNQPETGDDVEHLYSAWQVANGQIPYLDFFQHHNPLLWFIFAPLMKIFAYNLVIMDIVRIISTLVMLASLFIAAYTLKKFITNSWYSVVLCIASVFPSYIVFSGQDFRPDNYMVFSFLLGLFWLYDYLISKRQIKLVLSFIMFFLSFMFMQKIIFILGVVGASILFELYRKNIIFKDFLVSLIVPLFLFLCFICWLLYCQMLDIYWLSNYIFNLYIPDVYGSMVEITRPEFYVVTFLAFCGCILLLMNKQKYAYIIICLWVSEVIQRFFYFSLDRHYYYLLQIYNSVFVGYLFWILIRKYNYIAYIFLCLTCIGCFLAIKDAQNKKVAYNYHRYVTPKYILENTNKCDSVLNGYGLTYTIFTKNIVYYWNLNGQLDVIGDKVGLGKLPNLNQIILKDFPKFIYVDPYWDEKLVKQGKAKIIHIVDDRIKNKFYEQSIFNGVFVLKSKYQQARRCRYDATSDTWNYFYRKKIDEVN